MNFTDKCQLDENISGNITFHIPAATLCFATILMNLFSMTTFIRFRSLRQNNNNLLILSMSVADIFVAITTGSIDVVLATAKDEMLFKSAYIAGPICVVIMISGLTLIVMTLDRLVAIMKPLKYNAIVRRERLLKVVLFVWIMPAVLGIFSTVLSATLYSNDLLYIVFNVIMLLILIVLIISNTILFRSSLKASNDMVNRSIRTLIRKSTHALSQQGSNAGTGTQQPETSRPKNGSLGRKWKKACRLISHGKSSTVVYPSLHATEKAANDKRVVHLNFNDTDTATSNRKTHSKSKPKCSAVTRTHSMTNVVYPSLTDTNTLSSNKAIHSKPALKCSTETRTYSITSVVYSSLNDTNKTVLSDKTINPKREAKLSTETKSKRDNSIVYKNFHDTDSATNKKIQQKRKSNGSGQIHSVTGNCVVYPSLYGQGCIRLSRTTSIEGDKSVDDALKTNTNINLQNNKVVGQMPGGCSNLMRSPESKSMFLIATMAAPKRSSSCTDHFSTPNHRLPPLRPRACTTPSLSEGKLSNYKIHAPTRSVVQRWRRKYMKTKQKSCYMCLVYTVIYTSCILPVNIHIIGIMSHGWCPTVKAFQVLSMFILLNSLINPVLYFFKRKDFRKHLYKLLPCMRGVGTRKKELPTTSTQKSAKDF